MKNHVTFCIVLHNHQPVGNFGHVFEQAFSRSYEPFLDVLDRYPNVKVTLHTSGPLLDWLEENRPHYLDRLGALADQGRVELLGGGYYEPILTIIPRRDAAEQIRTMRNYLSHRFGNAPRGIWLTERIWEPSLPELLAENGVSYTLLDESHFRSAGVELDGMIGRYVVEKLGHPVHVFPIRKDLRYAIPFAEPSRTIEILEHLAEVAPGTCVTYGDDGEKFGLWPNTYSWVYERKWLDRFFQAIEDNADWLKLATLSEAFDQVPATGRAYLPATSYHEMTQWALPTPSGIELEKISDDLKKRGEWDRYERFIRGGFWDNFLVKYPEANRLHKRMMRVSDKISRCPSESAHTALAKKELMKGQCNCAYWHGLFGGLYLNYLRDAVTRHLAAAEDYADLMLYGGASSVRGEVVDYNLDGHDDVILENPFFRAVIAPTDGATLSEFVLTRPHFDITNVLTRRPETYHERVNQAGKGSDGAAVSAHDLIIAKEDGLADLLRYDQFQRVSFRDAVLDTIPTNAEIALRSPSVLSAAPPAYQADLSVGENNVEVSLALAELAGPNGSTISVTKHYLLQADTPDLLVTYRLKNTGTAPARFVWSTEWNLTLLAASAKDRWVTMNGLRHGPADSFEAATSGFHLYDGWQDFTLSIDLGANCTVHQYPIETVSQSESGFERTYQGTCFVAHRAIQLPEGGDTEFRVRVTFRTGVKD